MGGIEKTAGTRVTNWTGGSGETEHEEGVKQEDHDKQGEQEEYG